MGLALPPARRGALYPAGSPATPNRQSAIPRPYPEAPPPAGSPAPSRAPEPLRAGEGRGRAAWGGAGRGRGAERRRRGLRPAQVGAGVPAGAVRDLPGLLAPGSLSVPPRRSPVRGGAGPGTPGPAGSGRAELTARGWPHSVPSETAGGGSGPPAGGGGPAGRAASPPGSRYGPDPPRAHRGQSPPGHGRGDAAKPTRARSRAAPGRGSHAWIRRSALPRCGGRWGAAPTAPPRPCPTRYIAVTRGSPRGAAGRGVGGRSSLSPMGQRRASGRGSASRWVLLLLRCAGEEAVTCIFSCCSCVGPAAAWGNDHVQLLAERGRLAGEWGR